MWLAQKFLAQRQRGQAEYPKSAEVGRGSYGRVFIDPLDCGQVIKFWEPASSGSALRNALREIDLVPRLPINKHLVTAVDVRGQGLVMPHCGPSLAQMLDNEWGQGLQIRGEDGIQEAACF